MMDLSKKQKDRMREPRKFAAYHPCRTKGCSIPIQFPRRYCSKCMKEREALGV